MKELSFRLNPHQLRNPDGYYFMQYLSPFHILINGNQAGEFVPQEIQRSKRRMLAELELSQGGNLLINGLTYSKNDIVRFFEEIDVRQLPFHQQVYKNKPLLDFLERGEVPKDNWQATFPLTAENQPTYEFIQPFFAHQYNIRLAEAVKSGNQQLIGQLVKMPLIFPERNQPAYYSATTRHLSFLHNQLHHLVRNFDGSAAQVQEVTKFTQYPLVRALNILPEPFQLQRDQIGNSLADLFIKLYNRPHRKTKLAESLLYNGLMLVTTKEVENRLNRLREQLIDSPSEYTSAASRPRETAPASGWSGIRIVLFACFILVKLLVLGSRGCSSSSMPTYRSNTVNTEWITQALEERNTPLFASVTEERNKRAYLLNALERDTAVLTSYAPGIRPKTGFDPYESVFNPVQTIYRNAPILVKNQSKFDALMCMHLDDQPLKSYYIRAGETLKIDYMPITFLSHGFYVKWYCGKQWNDNLYFDDQPQEPTEEIVMEEVSTAIEVAPVAMEAPIAVEAESPAYDASNRIAGRFLAKARVTDQTPALHLITSAKDLASGDSEMSDVLVPVQEKDSVVNRTLMVLGKAQSNAAPIATFKVTSAGDKVKVIWDGI